MATRYTFDGSAKNNPSRESPSKRKASSNLTKSEKTKSLKENSPIQIVIYFYVSSGETLIVNYLTDIYFFQSDCLEFFQNQGFGQLKQIFWEAFSFYPNEFPNLPSNLQIDEDSRIIRVLVSIIPEQYPSEFNKDEIGFDFAQHLLGSMQEYLKPKISYLGLEPSFVIAKSDSIYADSHLKTPDIMLCFDAQQFSYNLKQFEVIISNILANAPFKIVQNRNQFCLSYLHPREALEIVKALRLDYTISITELASYNEISIEELEDLSSRFSSYFPESDIISYVENVPVIESTDDGRRHLAKRRYKEEQLRE